MHPDRIRIRCESCNNIVSFPATQAGSTQECGVCNANIDVPDSSTDFYDPNLEAQRHQDQVSEFERQQAIGKKQQEQYQRQLDDWEEVLQRKQQEATKMSAMIDRWNVLAERFEKLIARWDKD